MAVLLRLHLDRNNTGLGKRSREQTNPTVAVMAANDRQRAVRGVVDAGLAFIEASMRPNTDPEVLAMMMLELREAARASLRSDTGLTSAGRQTVRPLFAPFTVFSRSVVARRGLA